MLSALPQRTHSQVLQRWKDMTDAHFVPRPLPSPADTLSHMAAEGQAPAPAAAVRGLLAGTDGNVQQQQQLQQQLQADSQTVLASYSGNSCTASDVAEPARELQERAGGPKTVCRPVMQLSSLSSCGPTPQCNSAASSERSSDPELGAARLAPSDAQSSGVCKYFVNSGKCPRGATCPHRHDTSLRQQWVADR